MNKKTFFKYVFYSLAFYIVLVFFYYYQTRQHAINEAKVRVEELLLNYKAIRIFNSHQQKSEIYRLQKEHILDKEYFMPQILSSTYIVREVNSYYNMLRKQMDKDSITIKFASTNPKNIKNKATKEEEKIIKYFNQNRDKNSFQKVVNKKNGVFLYYAKPTRIITSECLKCHSNPKIAPKELIDMYGNNGFYEKIGNMRAIMLTTISLKENLKNANKLFLLSSLITLSVIFIILFIVKKLIKSKNEEHKKLQAVLDSQKNIIIVTNGKNIISANSSFLKFFGFDTLQEFLKKHDCICEMFLKKQGYFSLHLLKNEEHWIKYMQKLDKKSKIVIMDDKNKEHQVFAVTIDEYGSELNKYVISFTEITDINLESQKFEQEAYIDNLTGVFNRRKFDKLYPLEIKKSIDNFSPLSMIFFDIDFFKKINDAYGHDIGDEVLKNLAKIIKRQLRNSDIFARYGGEEFVILLHHTNIIKAKQVADKLRSIVKNLSIENIPKITCSFGVTTLNDKDTPKTFIKRADEALYEAKKEGRDMVVVKKS